jgi:hypothetical protein
LWQQFVYVNQFPVCQFVQHIFEPIVRVYAVHLTGSKQAVEDGAAFGCSVAAGKQVVFSAQGNRADAVLYRVVVYVRVC